MHLPIIWIERTPLLQVYFNHFIVKQGTIFQDIFVLSKVLNFVLPVPPVVSFNGPANLSFSREIPCANYVLVLIYYEGFSYFFPYQSFQKIVQFLQSCVRKSGGI